MLVAFWSGTYGELAILTLCVSVLEEYFSSRRFIHLFCSRGYHLFLWPLLACLSHFFCFFIKQYFCSSASCLFLLFMGGGSSNLFSCSLPPPLPPFARSLPLSVLYPSLRMKLWGRSAWPVQVAFLVALVMLYIDPVSAGSRNHRGPTGTPGLALNPSFQHHKRLITLSLPRYNTCSLSLSLTEGAERCSLSLSMT